MIDRDALFQEIRNNIGLDCPETEDATDLVHFADVAVAQNMPVISVGQGGIEHLWTWLEKTPTKLLARFFLKTSKSKRFNRQQEISDLSQQINAAFKRGAGGAQIFMPRGDLGAFVDELLPVRDGLFFNKDLCIGLNINEISASDWPNIFEQLKRIKADALLLYVSVRAAHDFVGRIYGILDNFDADFSGGLHFMLGDEAEKIEQVWRLTQKMRPDVAPRLRFFLSD